MRSLKLMVLGVGLILTAVFIQGTQSNMIYGSEIILVIIGGIFVVGGFFAKNEK